MSISVTGSVVNPGEYPFTTKLSLQEALDIAGGLKESVNFQPTGVITIRKRTSGIASDLLKTVNFLKEPKVLDSELVGDNYILIVQLDGEVNMERDNQRSIGK